MSSRTRITFWARVPDGVVEFPEYYGNSLMAPLVDEFIKGAYPKCHPFWALIKQGEEYPADSEEDFEQQWDGVSGVVTQEQARRGLLWALAWATVVVSWPETAQCVNLEDLASFKDLYLDDEGITDDEWGIRFSEIKLEESDSEEAGRLLPEVYRECGYVSYAKSTGIDYTYWHSRVARNPYWDALPCFVRFAEDVRRASEVGLCILCHGWE